MEPRFRPRLVPRRPRKNGLASQPPSGVRPVAYERCSPNSTVAES